MAVGVSYAVPKIVGAVAVGIALVLAASYGGYRAFRGEFAGPTPATVAMASLAGLREQNRLSAFAARFVAVVTSEQTRFGLKATKTLILPGSVRYEVDLARLADEDVRWDAASATLSVALPPVEIQGPEIDLTQMREFDGGGILMAVTGAGADLDAVNRKAGQAALLRQAREGPVLGLAREATRKAVARSFALPLKAAGLDATVSVRFADDPARANERWDVSRPIAEVLKEAPR